MSKRAGGSEAIGVAALLVLACGGQSPSADAGPDAGEIDAGPPDAAVGPAAPAPPTPPALTPCPSGWQATDADPPTCEPWPDGSAPNCTGASAALPGRSGCVPIGTECPAGEWPEDLPADADVLYVRASGEAGGAGTTETPFGRIATAVQQARRGTIIALGRGTFDEVVRLSAGVSLWGACAAETIVTTAIGRQDAGVVTIGGQDAVIRNLTISGARPGIWVGPGTAVDLQDVVVADADGIGILVPGGTVQGQRVVVRDTRGRSIDGMFGRGLDVEVGGQAVLGEAFFERNRDVAVFVSDEGSSLTLSDAAIRDTSAQLADGSRGNALNANLGATVQVDRAVLEGNRGIAILAARPGTVLRMTDVVVRDTLGQETDRMFGHGLEVAFGAQTELARTLFERNRGQAIVGTDPDTVIRLSDVVVRDMLADESDDTEGRGLAALAGTRLEATRTVVEHTLDVGVLATGEETTLALTDVVVRDTMPRASDGDTGRAVGVQLAAQADLTRVAIERAHDVALMAYGEATILAATDLTVRDTRSRQNDGWAGRALSAQYGARVQIDRAVFEQSREVGLFVADPGTTVTLRDVVVDDTTEAACVTSSCVGGGGGVGIGSYLEASVTLERFRVSSSVLCGLQLSRGGVADAHDGEVSHNVIGANVQTEGFDSARLMERVVYQDNERNFDAATLPVPTGSAGL